MERLVDGGIGVNMFTLNIIVGLKGKKPDMLKALSLNFIDCKHGLKF